MAKKRTKSEKTTIVGRQEITRQIAAQTGLTPKKASEVLDATLDTVRESLQEGNEVRLVGFGSFKVRRSAARKGVNPRDHSEIAVPEKDRVRFSPGKGLSNAVTSNYDPPAGEPPHIPPPPKGKRSLY